MIAATSQLITQNSKMMPYGQGRRLGESIDPRLMQADFSGYANAGMIQGQALANMGKQIGDVIKQRSDQKKQDAVDEKFLQQGSEFFKGTPMETTFLDAYQRYTSEDMTPRDKRALATSIKSLIPMGIEAHKMRMQQAELMAQGQSMVWTGTPQELDSYLRSGWIVKGKYSQNPDGTVTADIATPSPGIFGTGASAVRMPDGSLNIQPGGRFSSGATMPEVNAGQIRDAAYGFGQPPVGSDYDSSIIGRTPPPPQLPNGGGMDGPSVLPPKDFEPGSVSGQPLQTPTPQPAPQQPLQTPTPQTAPQQPSPEQLRAVSELAKQDVAKVNKEGKITGVTRIEGSMRDKEAILKDLEAEKMRVQLQQMKGELSAENKEDVKKAYRTLYRDNAGYVAMREINRALDILGEQPGGPLSSGKRLAASKIPGTQSHTLARSLATLENKVAFDLLDTLKSSSPTGGAVGSLSDPERQAMGKTQGSLGIEDDTEMLRENLKDLRRYYANYVHGTKAQRDEALESGKITRAEYDAGQVLWDEMANGESYSGTEGVSMPSMPSMPAGWDSEWEELLQGK